MIPLHVPPLSIGDLLSLPRQDYIAAVRGFLRTHLRKEHVVLTSDGRNALHLAVKSLGLKEGDEVLIPGYACHALPRAIESLCRPVCVDIDASTFNIAVDQIERRITPRTRVIVAVHLYGQACSIKDIVELARRHDLKVIEDVAQGLGGACEGKMLGSFGDMAVFSFRFTKDVTCFRGGALVSREPVAADLSPGSSASSSLYLFAVLLALKSIRTAPASLFSLVRQRVLSPLFTRTSASFEQDQNSLTNYQCYLLHLQLQRLEKAIQKRRENAHYYTEHLGDTVEVPVAIANHTYYRYTIRTDHRDELLSYLLRRGVEVDAMYSYALAGEDVCPAAARASRQSLNLPVHHRLSHQDREKIVSAIHEFQRLERHRSRRR